MSHRQFVIRESPLFDRHSGCCPGETLRTYNLRTTYCSNLYGFYQFDFAQRYGIRATIPITRRNSISVFSSERRLRVASASRTVAGPAPFGERPAPLTKCGEGREQGPLHA